MLGCGHRSKRGSKNSRISSCWIEYQICVCCNNELIVMKVLHDATGSSRLCSKLLVEEFNNFAKKIGS